ncbi:MAG: hypothetical protein LBT78_10970 [Tannerella sp.]|jgi:hypothetical protein|nr:hypothetical protein [Tannerella sp.]
MATKKAFWISYDFGLKGDYSGLYTWLDSVGAKECGDNFAFFIKECDGDLINTVKNDILKYVTPGKTDRIYLIYLDTDTQKMKGNFLFGRRKRAPWEGYSEGIGTVSEDFV